jgi:hypothetical protein
MKPESLSALKRLVLLALCLLPLAGAAEDLKFYDVEIIIFRNDKVPRSAELSLPYPAPTPTAGTLDLSDPNQAQAISAAGFSVLPPEEHRLADQAQTIKRSSRYELLLHQAWRQPGLDREQAIPVRIKAGRLFSKKYSSIDQFSQLANPSAGVSVAGFHELEGLVKVTLSRYLHTHSDLVLRKPSGAVMLASQQAADGSESLIGQQLINYSMNEQRRMRSNRLHYLDHPQFGMLVLITPYQAEDESPEDQAQPAEPEQSE